MNKQLQKIKNPKCWVGFIGGGRMAETLIASLGNPHQIIASDIDKKRLAYLRNKYGINVTTDNSEVIAEAGIIILAIKPQNIADAISKIQDTRYNKYSKNNNQLIISIAAGIPIKYLQKKMPKAKIIRAMPNNPCLVGQGMTCLSKGKGVSHALLNKAIKIFSKVGEVIQVPEQWLDAVTGLSGSGPAFVYEAIEALAVGGRKNGLPRDVALKLAEQTVLGAAMAVKATGHEPLALCQMVASPGGTTIEGLRVLRKQGFSRSLIDAVTAAAKKSARLSGKWAA